MAEITSEKLYEATFLKTAAASPQWREDALKYALDIRKFEIDLYWKRAAYFWTLIAASFAGYFGLQNTAAKDEYSIFVVSCIGLVISFAWYLVNRGSKYWQENWERHVDVLAEKIVGPLYRTTLSREPWWFVLRPYEAFPFSVSRVNQTVSLFITLLWSGLALRAYPFPRKTTSPAFPSVSVIAEFTAVFLVLLLWFGWPKAKQSPRTISFDIADLSPTVTPQGAASNTPPPN
jgi:hypothetical protein